MVVEFSGLLVLGGLLVLVTLVLYLCAKRNRRRQEAWACVARRLNLQYVAEQGVFSWPSPINGTVQEVRVSVCCRAVRGLSEDSTIYQVIEVTAPPGEPFTSRLQIYREDIFSKLGKVRGRQNIQLGARSGFDERYIIEGDDPHFIRRVLDEPMQRAILRLGNVHLEFEGYHGNLRKFGFYREAGNLEEAILTTVRLARRLAGRFE